MSVSISCMLSFRQQRLHQLRAQLNETSDLYMMESLVTKIAEQRQIVEWHKANAYVPKSGNGYCGWNEREWLIGGKTKFLFGMN